MKNIPKYEIRWKRSATGKVKSFKREIKLVQLFCYRCNRHRPLKYFPAESGYGSKAAKRTACSECLHIYQSKVERARQRVLTKGVTILEQVVGHYGGYKCVDCGITNPLLLRLYHAQGDAQGKQCRSDALGVRYKNHMRNYYFWLKSHDYPKYHQQVVLCLICHALRDKSRKIKRVSKAQQKPVALTDRAKMLEMFGITEEDMKEDD